MLEPRLEMLPFFMLYPAVQQVGVGATRLIREEFGCTWDQAHQALHGWGSHSKELRCRCVRLARYAKVLRGPAMLSDSVPGVLDGRSTVAYWKQTGLIAVSFVLLIVLHAVGERVPQRIE